MSGISFGVFLLPLALPVGAGIAVAAILAAARAARERAERQRIEAELRLKIESEQHRKEAERLLLRETERTRVYEEGKKVKKKIKEEEDRKEQSTLQEAERLYDIEKDLRLNIINIKKEIAKSQPQKDKDSREKKLKVQKMLQSMEHGISMLESPLLELIKVEIEDINNSLNKIKSRISGDYSYFENNLKWLNIRLRESIEEGRKKLEDLKIKALELLTDIEMIINTPLLPDKGRALALKTEIEDAFGSFNIGRLKTVVETLSPEIKMLYKQFLEVDKLNDERKYIMECTQGVLTEMGYNVSKVIDRTVKDSQTPIFMEFNIPGGEGIRLGFGIDKGIFTEVFHPKAERGIDKGKFKAQERKWCSDIDKMKIRLKEKGFDFNEKWRKDLTSEEIETIISESELAEPDRTKKEEEWKRRMAPKQRRVDSG